MNPIVVTLAMCIAIFTGSCRPSSDAAQVEVAKSLDSCNAMRSPSDTAGTSVGRGSAWARGAIRNFGLFSLFVPDGVRVTGADTLGGGVTLNWAECPGCRFSIAVAPDSDGRGIDGRVARLLAEQRAIDSANRDPHAAAREFDRIDGPPQPFTTATGRGFLVDDDCGDCMALTLLFGRPGYIAAIAIGGDDDVPMLPRHVCEMIVVGKSLRWRT